VDTRPIPNYFVREDTLAGPLYFWPMPAVRQSLFDDWRHRETTWLDDDGNPATVRGGYLITDRLTRTVTAQWPEPPHVDHYRRKAELSPVGCTLVEELVGKLVPAHSRACDKCRGLGYVE
jgi:hypothetical protein